MIDSSAQPSRFSISVRGLMILVPICGLICWGIGLAIRWDFETKNRARCEANLAKIGAAMQEYHAKYGHFPPAFVADATGIPTQSWRALLLEFLDPVLYQAYHFNEPWDGPHNRKLAARMPAVYGCPGRDGSKLETRTSYVVIVGPETAFPGSKVVKISDIRPPSIHAPVILVAEVANVEIPWMEPRDLRTSEMSFVINDPSKPGISSSDRQGAGVVSVDHQIKRFKNTFPSSSLKERISRLDGILMYEDAY